MNRRRFDWNHFRFETTIHTVELVQVYEHWILEAIKLELANSSTMIEQLNLSSNFRHFAIFSMKR